jgi:hypothetical protein
VTKTDVEIIAISLKGDVLKRSIIADLDKKVVGLYLRCISDGFLHYIKENYEEEEWELHRVAL